MHVMVPINVGWWFSKETRELLTLCLVRIRKFSAQKRIVYNLRVSASHHKAGYFLVIIFKRGSNPLTGESLGKIQMQAHVQFIFFCQLRGPLGFGLENHGAD